MNLSLSVTLLAASQNQQVDELLKERSQFVATAGDVKGLDLNWHRPSADYEDVKQLVVFKKLRDYTRGELHTRFLGR